MIFDLQPKETKKELEGRKNELDELTKLLKANSWVAVLGPRMAGKTSLIKAGLNELDRKGYKCLYVSFRDSRSLSSATDAVIEAINTKKSLLNKVWDLFKNTQSFEASTDGISWARNSPPVQSFRNIFNTIAGRGEPTIVAFDELQELSPVSKEVSNVLKYLWDTHGSKLLFVLSGSRFQLVRTIAEGTGMAGRPPAEISPKPFQYNELRSFFDKGLSEVRTSLGYDKHLSDSEISTIYQKFGGLVGWLTLFGNVYGIRNKPFETSLKITLKEGEKIVKEELGHFLEGRPREVYIAVLKSLPTQSQAEWSQIKLAASNLLHRQINDKTLGKTLETLVDASYVLKTKPKNREESVTYRIVDPVLAYTLTKTRLRVKNRV